MNFYNYFHKLLTVMYNQRITEPRTTGNKQPIFCCWQVRWQKISCLLKVVAICPQFSDSTQWFVGYTLG